MVARSDSGIGAFAALARYRYIPRVDTLSGKGYEALLFVSFGGPEGPSDVLPFLHNVTRGRHVPEERLLEVAHHYEQFGGKSPINEQNRLFIRALEAELGSRGFALPIYFGNRNWHPFVVDALTRLRADGHRRVLAFATSAFGSYSGCRQYSEDIAAALAKLGAEAPLVDKIRLFHDHPGFIAAEAERIGETLARWPEASRSEVRLVFTAHSVPEGMAARSDYVAQLEESGRLVAERLGRGGDWELAFQSRSGSPASPWLGPDVLETLRRLAGEGRGQVLVAPLGFLSDHVEVLYDLDVEAAGLAERLGMRFERAPTVGIHPAFVGAVADLVVERLVPASPRLALGRLGPSHDHCPPGCCRAARGQATDLPNAERRRENIA